MSVAGVIAIGIAVAASLIFEGTNALRLTVIAKGVAGLAIASASASNIALVIRNRDATVPAIPLSHSRRLREPWP